jgi:hypothetical protein
MKNNSSASTDKQKKKKKKKESDPKPYFAQAGSGSKRGHLSLLFLHSQHRQRAKMKGDDLQA